MEFATLVIMLALAQYIFFVGKTGQFRGKYEINAPSCSGDVNFERMFRIQQNTMEQLVIFIPALLAFSYFVSPVWGPCLGLVFFIGRFVYFQAYLNDPTTRGPGWMMTFFTNIILVLGTFLGVILALI